MSRLDRIEDWVERAKAACYREQDLARLCRVSRTQLWRYCAQRFGQAPEQLLNTIRICQAARLLCWTQLSVKEVARDLHFSDASQLCHNFKDYFGSWPSELAARWRRGEFGSNAPWESIELELGVNQARDSRASHSARRSKAGRTPSAPQAEARQNGARRAHSPPALATSNSPCPGR